MILERDVNARIIPALVDQVPVPARDINKSIPQVPGRPLLVLLDRQRKGDTGASERGYVIGTGGSPEPCELKS